MILCELHRTPRIGVGSSLLCMHGCKAVSVGADIAYVVYSRRFSLLSVEDVASHFMENYQELPTSWVMKVMKVMKVVAPPGKFSKAPKKREQARCPEWK